MIVYGDPARAGLAGALLARLQTRLAALLQTRVADTDALRALLIEAGEMEQAARDGLPDLPATVLLQTVTDRAADAFHSRWTGTGDVPAALAAMGRALESVDLPEAAHLTVKVPEGFAFYALYPEQYVVAARRWAEEHRESAPTLVVGIRSIGTTLSAIVAATLRAAGREVRRLTVRPTGHPFDRTTDIDPRHVDGAGWALIVDEGPGLSGSSFAAVAEALAAAGLDRRRIVFLPGHGGEPGNQAASPTVRAWWAETPRYVTPLSDLRWNGLPLPEALAARTVERFGPVRRTEDLGGGLWRRAAYPDPAGWPAVCAPFERPKYRCLLDDGTSVLWKFEGLGNEAAAFARLASLGEWTAPPLDTALGFVAVPWIEGARLSSADAADPGVLAHVGRYIARGAGPPLSPDERSAAHERLTEMVYWNTWEALGEEAAARTRVWSAAARDADTAAGAPGYGDGHLAPGEWLRTPDGRILKTDAAGHDADHTIVGRQPLAWDIAGAWVEWGLDKKTAAPLLDAAGPGTELAFYRLAYAAFRLGQTSFCAGLVAHDPEEQGRLRRAAAFYGETLTRLLASADARSPST